MIRAPIDRLPDRPGRAGHRQDGRRPAPRRVPAVRAPPPAGPRRRAGGRPEPGVPRLHRQRAARRSASAACCSARCSSCASPRSTIDGTDPAEVARLKGDARMLDRARARGRSAAISPPVDDVRVPLGARTIVFDGRGDRRLDRPRRSPGRLPINRRRDGLRALAQRELLRRTGKDDAWTSAEPLRKALDKAWPALRPADRGAVSVGRSAGGDGDGAVGRRRAITTRTGAQRWTAADQLLLDEANSILNGPPIDVRPCGRRRGPGPLGGRAAGDRPAQSDDGLVHDPRRPRPVHHPGRPAATGTAVRSPPRHDRSGRPPCSPSATACRPAILEYANRLLPLTGRRRDGEPQRARDGCRSRRC